MIRILCQIIFFYSYYNLPCGKDVSAGSSAVVSKCKKCKYPISNGVFCKKCGAISHPSCAKLLRGVKFINDTEMICCDSDDNYVSDGKEEFPVNPELLTAMEVLIQNAISPLLQQLHDLKTEVGVLRESNCELIKLLTSMGSYAGVAAKPAASVRKINPEEPTCENDNIGCLVLQSAVVLKNRNVQKNSQTTTDNKKHKQEKSEIRLIKSSGVSVAPSQADDEDHASGWKVQRGRFKRRKQNATLGSAVLNPENSFAAFQSKKAWYYGGRVKSETEPSRIQNYIKNNLPNVGDVVVEKLN